MRCVVAHATSKVQTFPPLWRSSLLSPLPSVRRRLSQEEPRRSRTLRGRRGVAGICRALVIAVQLAIADKPRPPPTKTTWQPMAMPIVDPASHAGVRAIEPASRSFVPPMDDAAGVFGARHHISRADRGAPAHASAQATAAAVAPADQLAGGGRPSPRQARPVASGYARASTVDLNSVLRLPTSAAEQADATRASATKAATLRWGHAPARTTFKGKALVTMPLSADAQPLFELAPVQVVEDVMVSW